MLLKTGHVPKGAYAPILVELLLIGVLLLSWAQKVNALTESSEQEILAIGTGTISDGNFAEAKERAIVDALTKGVERDVARRLGRQGMVNSFATIVQEILPAAKEAIENFHILAEEQTGNQYTLLVRLKVNNKLIEERLRDLAITVEEGPPVRILFLVSHFERGRDRTLYWWGEPEKDSPLSPTELMLYRVFEEYGFIPINRLQNIPEIAFSEEMKARDLTFEEAVRWGNAFSANAVVLGGCDILEDGSVSLTLTALNPETSTVLGRESRLEPNNGIASRPGAATESLTKAINKVVAGLSPQISRGLNSTGWSTSRFEVSLEGLKSFREFRAYKNFLEQEVAGVNSVTQTRIKGKILTVLVEFSGKEERFLEMITRNEHLPFQTEARKTDTGEIILRIR